MADGGRAIPVGMVSSTICRRWVGSSDFLTGTGLLASLNPKSWPHNARSYYRLGCGPGKNMIELLGK